MKNLAYCTFITLSLLAFLLSCEKEDLSAPPIRIELAATPASGYGAADGAVSSTVEGGVPPYHYFWDNGDNSPELTGVEAGIYTLKVIDSNSGVATQNAVVEQPEATPLDLQFTVIDVSTFGGTDGAVQLSVSGGTPPYTYLWSNGEEQAEISNLSAGTYSVTVTDAGDPAITTSDSTKVEQPSFVCGRDSILDVDGNRYPTVQLGDQCWTAENLRTLHQPDDPMLEIEGHFCLSLNCSNALGAHYTWEAAMNGAPSAKGEEEVRGVCPSGWHIPTRQEWETLNQYLSVDGNGGPGTNVPIKLRGPDSPSGFDALMAGNWGYSVFEGENAIFWTATEQSEQQAIYRLINNFPLLGQGQVDKRSGLSVRCVKNR